ncbi:uncharacterized protein B0P05DRAFT_587190 [Gilbertella persicaria]|uniref:uncharacterized protein n=1 Tax=Gilbertella persicaria TaxID=101096 RepID=UPI00221F5490|nr:uncharacterized protein B0P05DRAFT_587190 [Gilbertella persicaria]KAI8078955.1 hypothetical protein B0P05DRAFT_587190 [Gilbertella persicaria]
MLTKGFVLFLLFSTLLADNGCTGPVQVRSEKDVNDIRHCQTFEGSITIQNASLGDEINLSQLQQVHGDLVFDNNPNMRQIILASLRQITGQLKIQNNLELKRLDLTQLGVVRSLEISVEPSLDAILFPSGLSQIESLTVTDTLANRIEGIMASEIKDIHIANNKNLQKINLSHLQQVGNMTIAANAVNASLDISALTSIYHGDFRNLEKVIGLEKINQVTGGLSFVANGFSSLALPNVTRITGTLTVSNNLQLGNLSVPHLALLGGALSLSNNSQLTEIKVPGLEQVDGTVDLTGNFDRVDLPSLKDVRGGMNSTSSKEVLPRAMNSPVNQT